MTWKNGTPELDKFNEKLVEERKAAFEVEMIVCLSVCLSMSRLSMSCLSISSPLVT